MTCDRAASRAAIIYLPTRARNQAVPVRRTEQGFAQEVYEGLEASIPLHEIDIELPLTEVYEAVEFVPEPDGGAA